MSAHLVSTKHLAKAIALAAEKHVGQRYGKTQPYILHPMRLMTRAREDGQSLEVQVAAVLHDVVEDTPVSIHEIGQHFGPRVKELVGLLTKVQGETYPDYIKRVRTDPDAEAVKMLDIRDHLSQNPDARQIEKYGRVLALLTEEN